MRRGTSILWHRIESAYITQLAFVFLLAARRRTVILWRRVKSAYVTQFAFAFLGAVVFQLFDPRIPFDAWSLGAVAMLLLGGVLKITARIADNKKRGEWPLHVESSGNALCAAAFVLIATKNAAYARDWEELAGIYWLYGMIALIFLNRMIEVRLAIRDLHRFRRTRDQ